MSRGSALGLLVGVAGMLIAGALAIGSERVATERSSCSWNRIPATPSPAPSTTVLAQSRFIDRDGDGVPDRWGSSTDYGKHGCRRVTSVAGSDSVVKQVIHESAFN